jgi:H+-transporting ATPase
MGTQLVAALMAANGWLLTPISWGLIGFIWAYNLVWLVVIDAIKVALYHHYDARELGQPALAMPLDPFGGRLAS